MSPQHLFRRLRLAYASGSPLRVGVPRRRGQQTKLCQNTHSHTAHIIYNLTLFLLMLLKCFLRKSLHTRVRAVSGSVSKDNIRSGKRGPRAGNRVVSSPPIHRLVTHDGGRAAPLAEAEERLTHHPTHSPDGKRKTEKKRACHRPSSLFRLAC